jgi:outer membrane lipoprotein carrier protein
VITGIQPAGAAGSMQLQAMSAQRKVSPIRHKYVTLFVFVALLAVPTHAATVDLPRLVQNVEKRYNGATTLQVTFEETLSAAGRGRQTESGELFLRKPGRMRWEYSNPAGKLFLSDGKAIYYYSPGSKRAEKMKLKEAEDMRAPMAFLLGKLDFDKDFKNLRAVEHPLGTLITAEAKSEKLPYRQVEFVVSSDAAIRELRVHGYDESLLTFNFTNEKVNPTVPDNLFRFELPAGATWVDSSGEGESR